MKIPGSIAEVMERLTFEGNVAYMPKDDNGKPWKIEKIGEIHRVMRKLTRNYGQQPAAQFTFPEGVSARDVVRDALAIGVVPD